MKSLLLPKDQNYALFFNVIHMQAFFFPFLPFLSRAELLPYPFYPEQNFFLHRPAQKLDLASEEHRMVLDHAKRQKFGLVSCNTLATT